MARMEQVSLMELGKLAAEGQVEAEVFAQIAQCAQKMTKSNKPYLDVSFADAEGTMGLKVWEDKPWFRTLASLPLRSFVSLRGQWTKGGFGMEAADLEVRPLDEQEKESFLAGSGTLKKKQEADLKEICVLIKGMNDPRIRALCIEFIEQFGERLPARRRRPHLPSRPARRTGGACGGNDAHGLCRLPGESGAEPRPPAGRMPVSRLREAVGKLLPEGGFHDALFGSRGTAGPHSAGH